MSEDEESQFDFEVEKEEIEHIFEILKNEYLRMSKTSNGAENKFECKCLKKHQSLEQLQKHIREDHTVVRGLNHCTT